MHYHLPVSPQKVFEKKHVTIHSSSYPLILRILGFFSSSFGRKIHHPWRPFARSPRSHRVGRKEQQKSSWWFQPPRKILVKLEHFPTVRGENKTYLCCHHLEMHQQSHHVTIVHCLSMASRCRLLNLKGLFSPFLAQLSRPSGWEC